jgi:hypothetical protein
MNKFILIGLISLVTSVLFIGVFEDDEFYEFGIFTKHKPTTQLFFYSPSGMSDLTLQDLPKELQKEEIAFEEFVIKTGVQFPGKKYDFLPLLLIQLTLTFLSLGIFRIKFKNKFEKWLIPLHFIVNFIITSFILGGILISTSIYATIGLVLIILAINYFSIYKLKNQKFFNSSSNWKNGIIDTIDENNKM